MYTINGWPTHMLDLTKDIGFEPIKMQDVNKRNGAASPTEMLFFQPWKLGLLSNENGWVHQQR